MKIKCVESRVNVHILASTSVPFTLMTVQVPNLAPSHTKRITVHRDERRRRARKMPLFGSRMVCQTASYKYIEERDRKFAERENKLARYVRVQAIYCS